jgi:YD repeat-containing protein
MAGPIVDFAIFTLSGGADIVYSPVSCLSVVHMINLDEAKRLETLNEEEWEHDADGNVTVRVVGNETWNLTYDSQNQLIEIQREGAQNEVEYEYDGLGRRVKTIDNVSSTTREYVYAGSTL